MTPRKLAKPWLGVGGWVVVALVVASCRGAGPTPTGGEGAEQGAKEKQIVSLKLSSLAFEHEGPIPVEYTCDGDNISPPLQWSGVPPGARSLALICDDPDAPRGTWVHWVLYDIPPEVTELPEAVPDLRQLPMGAFNGHNDFKNLGYGGPCPPPGAPHRYFFKLYALDQKLNLEPGATKQEVLAAMEGHVLAQAELRGTYRRH